MNENLNLVEILKDCPKGTKLYSTVYGDVEFISIANCCLDNPIGIKCKDCSYGLTSDGRMSKYYDGECTLFPSREERNWSNFKVKKDKFDPQTLKAFDRVLVRDKHKEKWNCNFFSHISYDCVYYPYIAINTGYTYCIPYNDDTKHLIGTTEEAPEFYRYWED